MKNKSLIIVLANSNDMTVDAIRELVRIAAQSDKRFLKKPDGTGAVPSSVWVGDLIAPMTGNDPWRAIILAADNKSYQCSFTITDGTVKLGDDAKEVARVVNYQVLANDADCVDVLGLDNALTMDHDGWALLAPFGEHKKERMVRKPDGSLAQEKYIQVLDQAAVDTIIGNEKGTNIFQKLKRTLIKRPIYRDHPDLKVISPETINLGNDKMIPLGVNGGLRRTDRGLEFQPLLAPEGAAAVETDGCKYPSAVFLLKKTGVVRDGGYIEVRPFAVASVGLTPFPNISGVDSLANANPNNPAAKQTETTDDKIMKQLLIGWLAAQGVVLANNADDQAVFDAFTKEMTTRAANITALGNVKTNLEAVRGDQTKLVNGAKLPIDLVTAANEIFALGNAKTEAETRRKQFIETRVDLVIVQGKAPVADRQKEIDALIVLGNDKLDAAIAALDARPVKFPIASVVAAERKVDADSARSANEQVITLANNDPRYKDIKDFGTAFNAVLKDHPQLAEQLRAKPAGEKKDHATT